MSLNDSNLKNQYSMPILSTILITAKKSSQYLCLNISTAGLIIGPVVDHQANYYNIDRVKKTCCVISTCHVCSTMSHSEGYKL